MSAYHGLPPISKIAEALGGEVIKGQVLAPGPGHSPEDRSLSVKLDDKAPDGFVTNSFAGDSPAACRDHVRVKLGLPEWKPNGGANGSGNASKQQRRVIAEFVYTDQKGTPCLRVSRTEPKGFFQSYWTGNSWKPGGTKAPPVPYRLVQLIAASPSQTIFIVEGEGKANLLAALGFVATSASGGAKAPWSPTLNKWFAGRPAVVLPDNDAPGKAYAEKVARNLHGTAASVKIVELPDLRPKGDIKQWLEGDPSGAKLAKLVAAAPLWEPTESTDGKDGGGGEGGDEESDDNLILELAALTSFQYAKRRRAAAKQLRIRAEDLDKAVAEVRAELVGKDEAPVLYEHWTVERWPEPVDGGALLQELTDCLKRYVVMTEDQALVVALWIIFTWLHEKIAVHSPLLLVTSPQANSGKSTLLGVINFLARRALQSVSISGPALFRSIEKWQPTFVIDEADTVLVHNEDLKEVVNSGWTRGQCVIRCDPDTHKPRPYSTFAPKAIGMKGRKLPDTTLSRAIIVAIKRKRPDEMTADFDHLDTEDLARLRQQIARWARDNTDALVGAEPESPVGFHNRVRANWRLLLGIAERVGGRWKLQAQRAARAVEEVHDTFDPAIGIQLLADIRTAFEALNTERMTSAVMIAELVKDEEGCVY